MPSVNPYVYSPTKSDFNLQFLKQNKYHRHYNVTFPVVSPNCYPGGELAKGEYFEPLKSDAAPLAILVHGWGDHSVVPFKLMIPGLLKKGFACFILYQPFHKSRLPGEMKLRLNHLTADEWFTGYQMAVTDIQHIVDWANEKKHNELRKVAVIGLSLGGFVSSIAMGIDSRIGAGVFIVHGGNSGKITQLSRFARFRKEYRHSIGEYEESQHRYLKYVQDVVGKGFENIFPEQKSYLIDPLTYAHLLKGRQTVMINARWDEFIPQVASDDFWTACGKGERIILPATHASIWVWYPLIIRKIDVFLKSSFKI